MTVDPRSVLEELSIRPENPGAYVGEWLTCRGPVLESRNPSTGEVLATIRQATREDHERAVTTSQAVFQRWREVPAPRRGEVVRAVGDAFRRHKKALGALVTLEVGKILPEGEGEVQEIIDIADFAVGLSRQLCGQTMHSERPHHRMYEQWHPLGVVGIITAFNFPAAVWAWNAMIAAVCGNAMIWKPSRKAPLTALACQHIVNNVLREHGAPPFCTLLIGPDDDVGEPMLQDRRIPLVSATGSTAMGRHVAEVVGRRLGRTLLELGGNNGVIVMDDADLELALRAVLFGAVGTAGQRCTSTRRVIMHRSIATKLTERLLHAYRQITVGNPWEPGTLMGPLIDEDAVQRMLRALDVIRAQGGEILHGGTRIRGNFVAPTLVRSHKGMEILKEEIFAPVLHLLTVDSLDEALALHNDVPQGLSSALFTNSMRHAERFLSSGGSDCGIANVNLGTSGAEIGGAFGGEKDTGGGREAGSDAWKAYMRRQTNTLNWGTDLPLAQGIRFGE
ncbi:MAG: aldehyde dehydrogenase family protein [Myxococcota bacterium]